MNQQYKITDKRHGQINVTEKVYRLKTMDDANLAPQGTDAWFARRRNFLTASAIATVIGKSPYESRINLMRSKLVPTTKDSSGGNSYTAHGHKYELEAIKAYEAQTNRKCISFGLLESLNDGENFLAGSPDGITACGRLVEVKCPAKRIPIDDVPVHYMPQVQTLLHILQLPICDFVQYIPDTTWDSGTIIITEVKYDENFMVTYRPSLVSFWTELNNRKQELAENGTLGNDLLIRPLIKRDRNGINIGAKPSSVLSPICVEGCKIRVNQNEIQIKDDGGENHEEEEEEGCSELPFELLLNFNKEEQKLSL